MSVIDVDTNGSQGYIQGNCLKDVLVAKAHTGINQELKKLKRSGNDGRKKTFDYRILPRDSKI